MQDYSTIHYDGEKYRNVVKKIQDDRRNSMTVIHDDGKNRGWRGKI